MELPKTPGDSSPGTLPLWGASFSPPLGPDPGRLLTRRAKLGTSLGHLLRSPGAWGVIRARRCVRPGPHGVAGQQCQLRERWVQKGAEAGDAPRGTRDRLSSRIAPFIRILCYQAAQNRGEGAEWGSVSSSCSPPSSQACLGKEQGSGRLPPSWEPGN